METQRNEKAVSMAQEALRLLNLVRIKSGTYLLKFGDCDPFPNVSLSKEDVALIAKDCEVCALGLCFLGYLASEGGAVSDIVRKDFNGPFYGFDGPFYGIDVGFLVERLQTIMPLKELGQIEVAFEGFGLPACLSNKELDNFAVDEVNPFLSAVEFYDKHPGREARIRAILDNILANDGHFRPEAESVA